MRPRCPTCGAGFRGGSECGRCGTDLSLLSSVALAAHAARESARRALVAGDGETALEDAERSLRLHDTPEGRRLKALALIACGRLLEGVRQAAADVDAEAPEEQID